MAEASAAQEKASDRVATSARALLVVDESCLCVEASLGACRMLGAGRAEVVGRRLEDLLEPESRARFDHVWRAFRESGGNAGPFTLEAPATVVDVAVTVTPEVLPSRHLIALTAVAAPETETEDDEPARGRRFDSALPAPRGPTAREREVLSLLAAGSTDGQIAALLGLSPATVQTHVRNAKAKLGARTRAQAVALALQRGLIAPARR